MLLDTSVGIHWYDFLVPVVSILILAALVALVYGVVYFFVNLFREMHHD